MLCLLLLCSTKGKTTGGTFETSWALRAKDAWRCLHFASAFQFFSRQFTVPGLKLADFVPVPVQAPDPAPAPAAQGPAPAAQGPAPAEGQGHIRMRRWYTEYVIPGYNAGTPGKQVRWFEWVQASRRVYVC